MKLSELNDIKNSLAKLLQAPGIPAKTAYRAAKFSKVVAKEIRDLEDARVELVKKWGKADAQGNHNVTPENMAAFTEDLNDILDEDCVIPVMKISVEDVKGAGLTLLDFANLEFLFEEAPSTKE